jgi:hypothetical protein
MLWRLGDFDIGRATATMVWPVALHPYRGLDPEGERPVTIIISVVVVAPS